VLPVLKGVTKWAARCTDANRLAEYLDIAWRKMWAGRPGPVFLEVPTDILSSPVTMPLRDVAAGAPPMP
ncbi:thiamine pyrophosphate-binding protein, partial [Stenotrophomonas maltophilia]|uniref:thiamine pyrophosphate-binding protein n=1 Tax=Stenotrophomonas maltophilia TaxID=40324 RepID=UPI0023B79AFE